MIRQHPEANWHLLSAPSRAHFARRICTLGVESSGTTTLARELTRSLARTWVPNTTAISLFSYHTRFSFPAGRPPRLQTLRLDMDKEFRRLWQQSGLPWQECRTSPASRRFQVQEFTDRQAPLKL